MISYSEVKITKNISLLPKINEKDLKFLWYNDWWDGPISGMLTYQNKKYWFDILSEDGSSPDVYYRRYLIIELSEEQVKHKEYWHDLWVEGMGSNSVPDENGIRHTDNLKPLHIRNAFTKYYKEIHTEIDLSENIVIGYYEV